MSDVWLRRRSVVHLLHTGYTNRTIISLENNTSSVWNIYFSSGPGIPGDVTTYVRELPGYWPTAHSWLKFLSTYWSPSFRNPDAHYFLREEHLRHFNPAESVKIVKGLVYAQAIPHTKLRLRLVNRESIYSKMASAWEEGRNLNNWKAHAK